MIVSTVCDYTSAIQYLRCRISRILAKEDVEYPFHADFYNLEHLLTAIDLHHSKQIRDKDLFKQFRLCNLEEVLNEGDILHYFETRIEDYAYDYLSAIDYLRRKVMMATDPPRGQTKENFNELCRRILKTLSTPERRIKEASLYFLFHEAGLEQHLDVAEHFPALSVYYFRDKSTRTPTPVSSSNEDFDFQEDDF